MTTIGEAISRVRGQIRAGTKGPFIKVRQKIFVRKSYQNALKQS